MGVNLEFLHLPLNFSVHGEQFLISWIHSKGEQIRSIAVNAMPCGHCRQFLKEVSGNQEFTFYLRGKTFKGLDELLPYGFGPTDLLESIPWHFLKDQIHLGLSLTSPFPEEEQTRDLISVALTAANSSYSLYTQNPSGVGILTKNGSQYGGSYIESAAYNPSLSPIHAAIIQLWANSGDLDDIQQIVLVEKASSSISQQSVLTSFHKLHFPSAKIDVYHIQ